MVERIRAFIINLESNSDRRSSMTNQFLCLKEFAPSIVVATLGRTLPDVVCRTLVQHVEWSQQKGTIGCFLSHVAAWEQIARSSAPFSVVLEDDVDVSGLGAVRNWELPKDADIVFINDQMSSSDVASETPIISPFAEALKRLNASQGGPGAYGYLLTPQAAQKLLDACRQDLFFGHVDGRLLRYATSVEDLSKIRGTWLHNVISNHRHPTLISELGLLKGFTSSNPIVFHRGIDSKREAQDTLVASNA